MNDDLPIYHCKPDSARTPQPRSEVGPPAAGSADGPTPARYKWEWKGVSFDFYRLCEILGISHQAHVHALKKTIRAGRSIKTIEQDIDEAIAALLRWKEMVREDQQNVSGEGPPRSGSNSPKDVIGGSSLPTC